MGPPNLGLRPPENTEALLQHEIAVLEKQKEALDLTAEELKLIHERSARRKAIGMAQSMLTNQDTQRNIFQTSVAVAQPPLDKVELWCTAAAEPRDPGMSW